MCCCFPYKKLWKDTLDCKFAQYHPALLEISKYIQNVKLSDIIPCLLLLIFAGLIKPNHSFFIKYLKLKPTLYRKIHMKQMLRGEHVKLTLQKKSLPLEPSLLYFRKCS